MCCQIWAHLKQNLDFRKLTRNLNQVPSAQLATAGYRRFTARLPTGYRRLPLATPNYRRLTPVYTAGYCQSTASCRRQFGLCTFMLQFHWLGLVFSIKLYIHAFYRVKDGQICASVAKIKAFLAKIKE